MPNKPVLPVAAELLVAVEGLAALAAHLRVVEEGVEVDPEVGRLLAEVASELLGAPPERGAPGADAAVGLARAMLRSGTQLVDDPSGRGQWAQPDPGVLQGLGRVSMSVVEALLAVDDGGVAAALRQPGARFLDIGTGTAWLAIAMVRALPEVTVVGLDVWAPALELAHANVAAEGLADRVEVRAADAAALDEPEAYDAIWVPLPFIPKDQVGGVLSAALRALKPGGWLVPGTFASPPAQLAQLLVDLRIVRSGGHPWTDAEMVALLTEVGASDAHVATRTWASPTRLWTARR